MTLLALLGTVITALLPLLLKWLDLRLTASETPVDGFELEARGNMHELVRSLEGGDSARLATAFGRHDRLLREAGYTSTRYRGGSIGNTTIDDSGRVRSDRGLVVAQDGSGTGHGAGTKTLSRESGIRVSKSFEMLPLE